MQCYVDELMACLNSNKTEPTKLHYDLTFPSTAYYIVQHGKVI